MESYEIADIAEGYAVLTRALGVIGSASHEDGDHRLAKIVVDGELKIRALMQFAIERVAQDQR